MRNTTKLKLILQYFDMDFSMQDQEFIRLTIFNKVDGESLFFEDKSYTFLISKAYSYTNKLKKHFISE